MNCLATASWRVKAALIALVSAKIHGLAAGLFVMGCIGNPGMHGTAVFFMTIHAASVVAALAFAGLEMHSQNASAPKEPVPCST